MTHKVGILLKMSSESLMTDKAATLIAMLIPLLVVHSNLHAISSTYLSTILRAAMGFKNGDF